MFCKFCGKEIDESASYCQHCGGNINGENKHSNGINIENATKNFKLLLEKSNYTKFITAFSILFFVLSVIIRFTSQEIITVQHFLAYDDYYILSGNGKFWIIFFAIIQSLVLFACNYFGKKYDKAVKFENNILPLIAIIIEIILVFIKIPTPY